MKKTFFAALAFAALFATSVNAQSVTTATTPSTKPVGSVLSLIHI